MFAVLTHHLGAPFVPLDVDLALGAALDGRVVLLQFESRAAGEIPSSRGSAGPRWGGTGRGPVSTSKAKTISATTGAKATCYSVL